MNLLEVISVTDTPVCWKCGAPIEDLPLPLSRRAECSACHSELHVCVMCQFFDPGVSQSCREPVAEEVKDKKRANFCGYFQLKPDAFRPQDAAAARAARSELDALFGGGENPPEKQQPADTAEPLSEEALAKQRLNDLFKK